MRDSSNKRAVWVGLFILLGIIFLVGGILMIGNIHSTFKKQITVVAFFDDISGLQSGNNVWFSGVKIGTVGKINFYEESQVEVEVKINEKAQEYIRKNAKIKIGSDGLIGNRILVIYDGSSRVRPVENGDTLKVEKTFSQDDMINTLQENNVNLLSITQAVKTLSSNILAGKGTLGKLVSDDKLYNNLEEASASLRNASDGATRLIHSLNKFSAGLNQEGTLAHELVNDTVVFSSLKASAKQVQLLADSANALMNSLQAAQRDSSSVIGILLHDQETGANLKETVKNLNTSSEKLDEALEAAKHSFFLRGYFKKQEKEAKKEAKREAKEK